MNTGPLLYVDTCLIYVCVCIYIYIYIYIYMCMYIYIYIYVIWEFVKLFLSCFRNDSCNLGLPVWV
jgi:hypothetical protein